MDGAEVLEYLLSHSPMEWNVWRMGKTVSLRFAKLGGKDLRGCEFSAMDLAHADFSGADLSRCSLENAQCHDARFTGAVLKQANLCGADLWGAKDIVGIGPIGSRGDTLYAVRGFPLAPYGLMIKTGCFWGTMPGFLEQVALTHHHNRIYGSQYEAAARFIEAWSSLACLTWEA